MKTWTQEPNPNTYTLRINGDALGNLAETIDNSKGKIFRFTLLTGMLGDGGIYPLVAESLAEAKTEAEERVAERYAHRASVYRTMSCMCENIISELKSEEDQEEASC